MKFLLTALVLSPVLSLAQTSLRYDLSFPNYMHHEAVIRLTVLHAPGGPLTFRMSRSSPGRYATHEFGKNVYFVSAEGPDGQRLRIGQVDGDIYRVPVHGDRVVVQYTLFGDRTDGTYVGIDRSHAHLNMPGAIMWLVGGDKDPITLHFEAPQGLDWKVATQLVPTDDPYTFTAPGLQYLMDSPTELSDFRLATWEETNTDGKHLTFRIALHANIDDGTWNTFVADVRRVVEEEKAVYGEWADFDHGTYTFVMDAEAWDNGDGMEHRNSTCITLPMAVVGPDQLPRVLDVVSHEFFHSWNVKRIRPKSIEPFNFTKSNMSDELWEAEGFTQYYGNLILERAGFIPRDRYIGLLGQYLNGLIQSPGARYFTPIQSSRDAIYADAGVSIDKTNFRNTFFSYYIYGANIACILDLHLRKDFGKSLDTYMQALWKRFGKTAVWYDVPGLESTLASITTPAYAHTFFEEYVYSTRRDNWNPYFAAAGLEVVSPVASKAGWGLASYRANDSGFVVLERGPYMGSPLYKAGLDEGDEILSLNGHAVHQASDISTCLDSLAPGSTVSVGFRSRGVTGTVEVKLEVQNEWQLKPFEEVGQVLTPEEKAFREGWLGDKAQ